MQDSGAAQVSDAPIPEELVQEYKRKFVDKPDQEMYTRVLDQAYDWKFWQKNKIWIKNSTGKPVQVLVHWQKYPLKHLLKVALDLNAGMTAAGAGVALDWVVRERQNLLVAKDVLPADHDRFDSFPLGPEPDAAFVTAYVQGTSDLISGRVVPPRHSIELIKADFSGTVSELLEDLKMM